MIDRTLFEPFRRRNSFVISFAQIALPSVIMDAFFAGFFWLIFSPAFQMYLQIPENGTQPLFSAANCTKHGESSLPFLAPIRRTVVVLHVRCLPLS